MSEELGDLSGSTDLHSILLQSDLDIKNEKIRLLNSLIQQYQNEICEKDSQMNELMKKHQLEVHQITTDFSKKYQNMKEKFEIAKKGYEEQVARMESSYDYMLAEERNSSDKHKKEIRKLKGLLQSADEMMKMLQIEVSSKKEIEENARNLKLKITNQVEK